jgi:hypothetical protein
MIGPGIVPVWVCMPVQGMSYRVIPVLFNSNLVFLVIAVVIETGAIATNDSLLFKLIGVPWVLAGLLLVIGRFCFDTYRRAHTIYALTKDYAYIVRDGRFPFVVSLNLATTHPISFRRRGDGSGTVTFGPRFLSFSSEMFYSYSRRTFSDVPNVDEVFRFVTDAVVRAHAPKT